MKRLLPLVLLSCLAFAWAGAPYKNEKPSKSVTEFLAWYAKNRERLVKINLVRNYVNASGPTGKNYAVDYKGTEQYLTELKKSTYIGPKYVEKQRNRFKQCDAAFTEKPQNTFVPQGFENDLVMLSPDPAEELAALDKAEIKSEIIESNSYALVMIKFSSGRVLKYELAKQNDKWLINDISL